MTGVIKFTSNRVWRTYPGGKLLDAIENKDTPQDSHFPEDWIGSTVQANNVGREHIAEGLTMVINDAGEQVSFKSLLLNNPDYYLGECQGRTRQIDDIPLVKYLDSATRLHFQVHPSSEFAQQRLGAPRGKTEAYVILAVRDDVEVPYIYAGFQHPPSREQLRNWIEGQDIPSIEACFERIPVKPGDVFLLPGGRPHALGEGLLMLEIMEPSDLAVRFEFERCGYVIPEAARFMNRDIETALDVFDFSAVTGEKINQEFRCQPKQIIQCDGNTLDCLIGPQHTRCFTVKRALVNTLFSRQERECFFGIVTEGEGAIKLADQVIPLEQWDRFFCPAGESHFEYLTETGMTVLECYPGGADITD